MRPSETAEPAHRALGLITVANAYSLGGLGRDAESIALYEEAAGIYRAARRPVDEANAQIAKILALTNLGRHEEAFAAGRWAAPVLESHGEWLKLGKLTANLGNLHFRRGEETQALAMFDRARETYGKLPGDPAARGARSAGWSTTGPQSCATSAASTSRSRPASGRWRSWPRPARPRKSPLPAKPRHLLLHPRPAQRCAQPAGPVTVLFPPGWPAARRDPRQHLHRASPPPAPPI